MPVNNKIDERNKDIKIYINGSFHNRDDAKISVFDSGYLLGDGIWEGIRLVKNEWMFLDEHLNPKMLKDSKIIHHKYNINSSYIYEYEKQDDIKNLILDKAIEVQKEN